MSTSDLSDLLGLHGWLVLASLVVFETAVLVSSGALLVLVLLQLVFTATLVLTSVTNSASETWLRWQLPSCYSSCGSTTVSEVADGNCTLE